MFTPSSTVSTMCPPTGWVARSLLGLCVALFVLTCAGVRGAAAIPPTITLGAPTATATGVGPRALEAADLNGDGLPDFVVLNADSTLSVLLGNAASPGTYLPKADYPTPSPPSDVAVADLDRNGAPDLVVISCGCTGGAPLSIYFGNGDGTFGARDDRPLALEAFAVAVGDLDRDGVLDLVISNEAASTVAVLIGITATPGTFLAPVPYAVAALPRGLSIADLDRDGVPDIAVASFGTNAVSVLLGAGDGTFVVPAVSYATDAGPVRLVVGDYNRDGVLDLVTGNSPGRSISVLLGQPGAPGAFGAATTYALASNVRALASADLNGDGVLDIVATDGTATSGAVVFRGRGDGTFDAPASFGAGPAPFGVDVADVDRDGRPDVTVTNRGGGDTVSLLLNTTIFDGAGVFFSHSTLSVGARPQAIAAGDFNGDGLPDLVITRRGAATSMVTVRLGNGPGTFGGATSLPGPAAEPVGVAAGDVNGDGRLDVVWINANTGTLSVAFGNGNGTFAAPLATTVNALGESFLVLDDVDRDGVLDAVVSKPRTNRVAVLLGNGDGTFVRTDYPTGGGPRIVAVADADGDGAADIVTANTEDDTISVLLNTGAGAFAAKVDYAMDAGVQAVAVGDVNGDGVPDLVSANAASYSVRPGIGDGTFAAPTDTALGAAQKTVVIADMNRDGRADLVFGAAVDGVLTVVAGTGGGAFGAPQLHPVTTGSMYVAVADVDRDGRPDVLTANPPAGTASILLARAALFRFSAPTYSIQETDGIAIITVVRDGDTSEAMTVRFVASAGTATANDDYTPTAGTLAFGPGETSKTFSVTIADDTVTEGPETIALTLRTPTGDVALDSGRAATLTILADDPPRLSFDRARYVTDEAQGTRTITVLRDGGFGTTVTVDYATSDGTAIAGDDYTETTGTLTFGPTDTSQTFAVPIIDDTVPEGEEALGLALSNPDGGAVLGARRRAQLTINPNDPVPPAITSSSSTTFTVGSAGSFGITTTGFPTVTTITRGGVALPAGVTYTDHGNGSATLSGTPGTGTAGTYALSFTASNGVPPDAVQNPFTLNVVCPVITITGNIPPLRVNRMMDVVTVAQSGGNGTIVWSSSGLPAGISLDAGTGQVSGMPTVTGTFSVTITATDAGACSGSKSQSLRVAPLAVRDTYGGLVDNTQLVVTGGMMISPSTPFVASTTALITNDEPTGSVTATAGTFATTAGGSVVIAADGTFTYTPGAHAAAAAITTDTFTYTVFSNTGGGAPVTSAPTTVTLQLADRVWYVLHSGAAGNGQSQSPFNTLASAVAASTANDTIYVYRGTGAMPNLMSPSVLKSGQRLIGQGTALVANGVTLIPAGAFPRLGGTVTLASDVQVDGLDLSTGAATGIAGTSVSGVAVTVRTLATTTGTAVAIGGAGNSGDYSFRSVSSDGAVNGISLANFAGGTFTVTGDGTTTAGGMLSRNGSGGTIAGATGHAVLLRNARNVTLRQMNVTGTAVGGLCAPACTSNGVHSVGGRNILLLAMSLQALGGHGWYASDLAGVNRFANNGLIDTWNSSQANGILVVNTDTSFTSLTIDGVRMTTSATGGAGVSINAHGATTGRVTVTDSEFTAIDHNAVQINNNGSGILTAIVRRNTFRDADADADGGSNTLYLTNHGSGQLDFTVGGPTAADGNTFRNVGRVGALAGVIQVDSATVSTAGARLNGSIQHNTIANDAGVVNGRRGIDIQLESNAGTHGAHAILIADNAVSNVARQGVSVTLATVDGGEIPGADITIRNNTLTNVGTDGGDSGSAIEIESNADAADTGSSITANVLLEGNAATNDNASSLGSTLEINNRAVGGNNTSVFNITARGNRMTNAATIPSAEVFEILNASGTPTTCLDLNAADDPAGANAYVGGAGTGFKLTGVVGTFSIAGMAAGPQTAGDVAAFLSPRNEMLTVTASGAFAGIPSCPLPALPTF